LLAVYTQYANDCKIFKKEEAHCKEDSNYVFPEIKLRRLVPNLHIHTSACERLKYSQDRSTLYFAAAK
jgi:hypothetical protein